MRNFISNCSLIFALAFVAGCASWRPYDRKTNTVAAEAESIAPWKVDDAQNDLLAGLEEHGQLNVREVVRPNPAATWTLGSMMVIGAIGILVGIGTIWLTKGVKLIQGLLIAASGVSAYLVGYLLDNYLPWICLGFGLLMIGAIAWVFATKKNLIEGLIRGFEVQKNDPWDPAVENKVKRAQGTAQPIISKIRKRIMPEGK